MICIYCGNEIQGRGKVYCSRACANAHRRIKERQERKTYAVWSCGGGVQSTAIAALIYTGKIAKPDFAVMVDTGYEKSTVMAYVKGTIQPKMAEVGVTLHIVKTSDYLPDQSILDKDGYCIIPVYAKRREGSVLMRTCCNGKWKVNIIRKWLLENGVEQYRSLIGISTEESHRQRKAHKKYYVNTYPLIDFGMDRDACIDYITKVARWPEPIRSSCYICGQQDDGEWWRMAVTAPGDLAKAAEVEREIQRSRPDVYLHRSCKPIDQVFRL